MAERRFENRVVMITGAAGGFGAAAARRFAAEGAALVLSDMDKPGLASLTDDLTRNGSAVFSELVDVTSEKEIESHIASAATALGPLDVAINNAGIGQSLAPLTETTLADYDRIMAVNARGVFLGMKHQLPGMIALGRGAILNVASAAGLVGAGQLAAYAASKHAVVGLTRAAADEVARKGIRINALCPSFAPTPLFNEMADEIGARHGMTREDAYARIAARIPMRRVARVDEVVQAMLWACDPANSFMTGQTISIDGGLTAV
jgi:NAD(P)-dependent dehydrogenase (short-subunit alcohol dehydrogenase family)